MKGNELFQVNVEDRRNGATYPIGPAIIREAAESFMVAINAQIASGNEKVWANPHLVPALKG